MKAIVYHGPRDMRVDQVPDPAIDHPADALVRIERTAICGSDLHIFHGPDMGMEFAVGHEFLGTVEAVGADVTRFGPGDRVVVSCTIGCGACPACHDHLASGCLTTTTAGPMTNIFGSPLTAGGQAEAARVPYADYNLFPIPPHLDDEQVLFLTDILPTGYMGADLAEVGPGDVTVVFGCGPVGAFAQQSALLRGAAAVVAVDLDDGRLDRARTRGCITVNPAHEDLEERVRELTGGRGADAAIEAVGRPELVQAALRVVRPEGRVAVVGVIMGTTVPVDFFRDMLGRNLTLRGGTVNPQRYIPTLLPLIEHGRLDPTEIITHRMPLDQGPKGYEIFDAHDDDVLKVVLTT